MTDELEQHHVHHSYIWLSTLRVTIGVLLIFVISLASSIIPLLGVGLTRQDLDEISIATGVCLACFIGTVAVVVVMHVLAYKRLYFTLGQDEFSLYSGIFTKKRVHVPYDRVQSVDARASLLQRIFGVRSVFIDTAGGAANKAIVVPYLTKAQSDWLTNELYARKRRALQPVQAVQSAQPGQPGVGASNVMPTPPTIGARGNVLDVGVQAWDEVGGVFAGQTFEQVTPSFEYGLTNKELFLAGLSNNTSFVLMVIAFLGVVAQIITTASDLFPRETDAVLSSFMTQVSDPLFAAGAAATVGSLIVLLAILWVLSAVTTCISFGGFRARRVGDRIEVEHGLLQHSRQSISIQRVQAVVVKQSVIRRLIGYCEVSLDKVDAQASDDSTQKNSLNATGVVVHPFCKLTDVPAILSGLVPEYVGIPQGRTALPKVAHRRAITRRCIVQGGGFWLAICTGIAQIVFNVALNPMMASTATITRDWSIALSIINPVCFVLYGVAIVCFVLEAVSAVKWAKESGFATNDYFMKVVNGGLSREERSFPRNKIQFGYTKTNPLQRMAHVATINARTAAGVGGTTINLKDVRREDADAWLAWLEPRSQNRRRR